MRVISLNAWGGRLVDNMVAYLADAQPDILCLQEVVQTPDSPADLLEYRDDGMQLPQRANVIDDVAKALPGHAITFCPAARGNLWHGDQAVPTYWGLATFIHPRLTLVGQVQGFVHGTFGTDGFGDHPRSRTGHVARVWHPDQGFLTVGHMHGLRDMAGKMDTPLRSEQARRFGDMVKAVHQPGDPTVVCGDFNVLPGSETLRILARTTPYDLVTSRGHDGTRTSFYEKPEKFADYMLVNGPLKDADFEVVRTPEVSDHCALRLDTV
ncbi:endonuclease/exonuclease/phosphatase family protein [Pseudooceanicola sp. MF1-13]|uniref:endonuclease/exonuclease/phosphatase family protein n=1 Tax=Pseudooceanicola sp. MF1-13 TaxID=3379095 RepID=UPI003892A84C